MSSPSSPHPSPRPSSCALLAATVATLLSACGGGSSPASAPTVEANAVSVNPNGLDASKPGELLATIKTTLAARVAQGIVGSTPVSSGDVAFSTAGSAVPPAAGLIGTTASSSSSPLASSSTTVQEAGVDEEDLIKSAGDMLYTLDTFVVAKPGTLPGAATTGVTNAAPQLRIHRRAADGKLSAVQSLPLPDDGSTYRVTRGMLLAPGAGRLAVLGQSTIYTGGSGSACPPGAACIAASNSLVYWPGVYKSEVQVQAVELAQASSGAATAGTRLSLSGQFTGSRLIGSTLMLVSTYSPNLTVDQLPLTASQAERNALLALLTEADVLPTLRVNGGAAQPLVAGTECYVQAKNSSTAIQITTITAIDLSSPALTRNSRCFAGGSEAIYMSPTNLYVSTTRYSPTNRGGLLFYPAQASTDIHKFAVNGLSINYRGSGEVAGHLGWDPERKPYRMGEFGGDLRVLSFTGSIGWAWDWGIVPTGATDTAQPASPATLTVLRERASDASLQVVSTLPNSKRPAALGHAGEQVYGVRFAGERAYVVTFRRTDPLYVLDLSNPADPQTVGELQVPGFSDYLFPLDNGLLLGVGKDASDTGRVGGVKVGLFDVKNASQPKALQQLVFGVRGSASALDSTSHGINLFTRGSSVRIALPTVTSTVDWAPPFVIGLQRMEVDTQARTLSARPVIVGAPTDPKFGYWYNFLSADRSLQIESQVYWLHNGQLSGWDW